MDSLSALVSIAMCEVREVSHMVKGLLHLDLEGSKLLLKRLGTGRVVHSGTQTAAD